MEACPKLLECLHLEMDLLVDAKKIKFTAEKQQAVLKGLKKEQNELIAELNDILGPSNNNFCSAFIDDFEQPFLRATPCRMNINPIIFDEKFIDLECSLSTSDDSNSDTELYLLTFTDTLLYK